MDESILFPECAKKKKKKLRHLFEWSEMCQYKRRVSTHV